MKLVKRDILVTSCTIGKNKQDQAYINIQFVDMQDQNSYQVISKNLELAQKLQGMKKYKVDLELTSSKYGLKLDIPVVLEDLGAV